VYNGRRFLEKSYKGRTVVPNFRANERWQTSHTRSRSVSSSMTLSRKALITPVAATSEEKEFYFKATY
jgi:hypothetical protein